MHTQVILQKMCWSRGEGGVCFREGGIGVSKYIYDKYGFVKSTHRNRRTHELL